MTVVIEGKKVRIPNNQLLTYDDYVRLTPPDNGNYELHNGKIVFMASPLAPHQVVSMNLSIALGSFIVTNKLGRLLAAPMDVKFALHDTVQPDLLFISRNRLSIIQKIVEGAPDLIIEIKSEGNTAAEMKYKKELYEKHGVREYWYITIDKPAIKQYEWVNGELVLRRILHLNDVLQSVVIEGFEISVAQIFE